MENIVMKCECCNRVKELRLGICFDCATSESIIVEGVDMYDREVEKSDGLSDGLSKVKHILKLYGIIMELPLNNRIRAEYMVPKEIIERSHIPDDELEGRLNKQLMTRIADEILMAKPDIVTHSTFKFDDKNPYAQKYHRLTGEVFVFTYDELIQLIRRIEETSTQIRE